MPLHDKPVREWITFVAGVIGILAFLTGIHSLPDLLRSGTEPSMPSPPDAPLRDRLFWPVVVVMLLVYFSCVFVALGRMRKAFEEHLEEGPNGVFWFFVCFLGNGAILVVFYEGFFGPVIEIMDAPTGVLYLVGTVIANLFTVGAALRVGVFEAR